MGNGSKSKNSFLEGGTMSHPVNDEILENLYEEELGWFMNNRPTNATQEQIENAAAYYARKRFEDMCQ